jgi:hypothetical protein
MRIPARTEIACSPEQVFDTLSDLRNDARWNSRVTSAELRSPEPIGPGASFAIVNGGTAYDATLTTYDRPRRLVVDARGGNPDLTITYTLTPRGEGTDIESEFDFRPRGFLKALFPLLAPVIRRDVPKQFASLKAFCERAALPGLRPPGS